MGWHPREWGDVRDDDEFWSMDSSQPCLSAEWKKMRNSLAAMRPGDIVVAMLPDARVGRIGEIVRMEIEDHQWSPIIQRKAAMPFGENGRRILVRWNLVLGPENFDTVTRLPKGLRNFGQHAISWLDEGRYMHLAAAVADARNWEPFYGNFRFETALSDYIAMHPYRLQDGLRINRDVKKFRECSLSSGGRIDVVLEDRARVPVLVECKQEGVVESHIHQLTNYLKKFHDDYPYLPVPRGILVHGGSRRVDAKLRDLANDQGISLVHHELRVDFLASD